MPIETRGVGLKGETRRDIMFLGERTPIRSTKNKQRNLLSMWNDDGFAKRHQAKSFILIPNALRKRYLNKSSHTACSVLGETSQNTSRESRDSGPRLFFLSILPV